MPDEAPPPIEPLPDPAPEPGPAPKKGLDEVLADVKIALESLHARLTALEAKVAARDPPQHGNTIVTFGPPPPAIV